MDKIQLQREVYFTAVRSRGPGGQNVNKVSSAAVLYWNFQASEALSETQKTLIRAKLQSLINKENQIYVRSDEFRDLQRNKDRCFEKLLILLAGAFHRPKHRTATKPTRSSKLRKLETKTRRSETKRMRQKIK